MIHHLLDLLHLIPAGVYLAGTVMLPTPGGSDGALPPPTLEISEPTTETAEEKSEPSEELGDSTQEGAEVEGQTTTTTEKIDWRTISPEVKAHLQAISKENPKLGNMLQNAVYTSQSFIREFPKGIKEARDLKAVIEEAGGITEIQSLRSTYESLQSEQESLDNRARSGDPAVLENLVEIAGTEGFSKLMPTALDRWASADPASYNHVLSKVMVSSMRNAGVLADIQMAYKMLGLNNPEATKVAIQSLDKAADWINDVGKVAANAPEKPKVDPKIAEQQQNIDTQREEIFRNRFNADFGGWRDKEIRREVAVVAPKGKVLSDYQMATLGNKVIEDIKSLLTKDSDYTGKLSKFYNARDMEGLNKLARSRYLKLLPDVTKKVYRELFTDLRPKTAAATAVDPKAAAKLGAVAAKPGAAGAVAGWIKVSPDKAPRPEEIDNNKTPFEMKFRKAAILRDGRKVYWGNEAPK